MINKNDTPLANPWGLRSILRGALSGLLLAGSLAGMGEAQAVFIMKTETYELIPGVANQEISIYYSNTAAPQSVAGFDLNLQVGDGGPEAPGGSVDGPSITAVDLKTSTIFGGLAASQVMAPSVDQVRVESITLDSGTVSVPVVGDSSLLMATVTIDTTGFNTAGATWTLNINNTLNGDSQFLDGSANAIAITAAASSITIAAVPEPEAYAAFTAGLLILFTIWSRRRDRVATVV
ncbi:hypothetical protein N9B57_03590 [Verrucomicrobia bacterium]|nr:hypothetical protein [Verrucomicrobiota bacterium]MDA7867001.1 hypothetical protein [Verrucomicrobiota bacterium]